jgi:hypothetical protein
MTTYETLSLLFSIASSICVVFSLWLLYRQNRIFSRQLVTSQSHNITDYSLEISRLFLAHPDMRPYFFGGQAIAEGHPDYLRAESLAEVILDILWTMQAEARRIDGREFANNSMRSAWDDYVDGFFITSPVMVSFLTKRGAWYGDEMTKRLNAGLAKAKALTEPSH